MMPNELDLDLDVLIEAFERYSEAKRRHDKAASKYEGHSWGYFGNDLIQAMDEARSEMRDKLRAYVKSEVADVLKTLRQEEQAGNL
jgi:hypothetical protein